MGIAIMAVGVLYWAAWRIVPRWFGVEYVPRKEVLADGTVVTLVRSSLLGWVGSWWMLTCLRCAVLAAKDRVRPRGVCARVRVGSSVTIFTMLYYGIYDSVVMEV